MNVKGSCRGLGHCIMKGLLVGLLVLLIAYLWGCQGLEDIISGSGSQKHYNKSLENMKLGEKMSGFILKSKVYSKDYNAETYLFEHEKSGGQVVYIGADDDNRWFQISVITPPEDNTGVNHIIEHTLLQGSEKYPLRGLFTEMIRRSVGTEINAYTDRTTTCYPFATNNLKDYENLMKVYLDSYFAPRILMDPHLFKQEGWRYTYDSAESRFDFNGIVLNEMKGIYLDKWSMIDQQILCSLLPNTPYVYKSGGLPSAIVDLSYEQLVDTYKRYYTPSNTCISFYGNIELKDKLAYIHNEYYKKLEKISKAIAIEVEEPFEKALEGTFTYPAQETMTSESDSILAWALVLPDMSASDLMGLEILTDLMAYELTDNLNSYLNRYDIVGGLIAYITEDTKQKVLVVIAEGINQTHRERLNQGVRHVLEKIHEKGIAESPVDKVLNSYEIKLKSRLNQLDTGAFALNQVEKNFAFTDTPLSQVSRLELIQEMRSKSKEEGYFENLVEKYLLTNNHQGQFAFLPDSDLHDVSEEQLNHNLNERMKGLSDSEKESILNELAAYGKWENEDNKAEDLKIIPCLRRQDLSAEPQQIDEKQSEYEGVEVVQYPLNSHGMTTVSFYFKLFSLTDEELDYLPLFEAMLRYSDTAGYSNNYIAKQLESFSEGFVIDTLWMKDVDDPMKVYPYLKVTLSYLSYQEEEVIMLLEDLMINPKFNNPDLLKREIDDYISATEENMSYDGDFLANATIAGSLCKGGKLAAYEYIRSYERLMALNEDPNNAYFVAVEQLEAIKRKVFHKGGMYVSIGAEEAALIPASQAVEALIDHMPRADNEDILDRRSSWGDTLETVHTGLIIQSDVQYIYGGFHWGLTGSKLTGADVLFNQILSDGYMYKTIREQGGAYGGYCWVSQFSEMLFMTYRDPHLKRSIEVIEGVGVYLDNADMTQEELEHGIVYLYGRINKPRGILSLIESGDHIHLNPSYAERNRAITQEILKTRLSDLEAYKEKMKKGLGYLNIAVAGSEEEITKNKDAFDLVRDYR